MFIFRAAPRVGRRHTVWKTDADARETMRRLNEYLDENSPELAEWLYRNLQDMQNAFTYKELREAALAGFEPQIRQWQEDYAEFINDTVRPKLLEALEAGAAAQIAAIGREVFFDNSDRQVQEWLARHTGELITNIGEETRKAVQTVIGKGYQEGWSSDELARKIRPTVGLTVPQTAANLNYQKTIYESLLEAHPRMKPEQAERKAVEAGYKYAGKQHRYRAQMIADTELAFAYNQGAHESVRQAMRQNLMGPTVKIWSTARDERTCPTCGSLNGRTLGFDDSWADSKGSMGESVKWASKGDTRVPPAHPNCRCTVLYKEMEAPAYTNPFHPRENNLNTALEDDKIKETFTPAKTVEAAEQYAKDVLGIPRVSYKGNDLETTNEWNRGLFEAFQQFPELKKNFGFVGDCRERNRALKVELVAYYDQYYKKEMRFATAAERKRKRDAKIKEIMDILKVPKTTFAESLAPGDPPPINMGIGITVNSAWGKDSENFKKALDRDVKKKFHPKGCNTIRSVLDHEIGHQLDDLLSLRDVQEIKDLFNKKTKKEITNELSEYSWRNTNPNRYSEFIAEAWAEFCNTKPPRRDIAQKVGEIVIREYNKKFGGKRP